MAKIIMSKFTEIDDNLLQRLKEGETIKPVRDNNFYYVTNRGRVFTGKKTLIYEMIDGKKLYCVLWKELHPRLCNGYFVVNIDSKKQYIHKLVFEAFNGWINTAVLKIVHKDRNKLNNNLENLKVDWRNKNDTVAHERYLYQCYMRSKANLLNDYNNTPLPY